MRGATTSVMRRVLLKVGPHVIAVGAGLALGVSLARISAPPADAPPTAPAPALAPELPPTAPAVPGPQGTAKERIALVFSLAGKPPGHARDAELYRAILALAPEDFPVAAADLAKRFAAYGKGLVGQKKSALVMEAFLDRWLTLDAPGALRYLAASDLLAKLCDAGENGAPLATSSSVVDATFRPLAWHAPQWTHDWIAAQKPGPDRDWPIRTLLEEVARRDIAQARRFFAGFADGPNRADALRGLVGGMAETDPRAGFEVAMGESGSRLQSYLLDSLMPAAARQGPALAQELLRRIDNPDDRFEAAITALRNLPSGTGDDLLPWMQEEVRQRKEFSAYWMHEGWARTMAEKVPGAALAKAAEWAAALPNDPQRIFLRQIAERWAKDKPAALREWLARNGATLDAASASALRASFTTMAKGDAGAVAGWVETLPAGPLRQQALLNVALQSGGAEDAGLAYASLAAGDKDGALANEVADILAKKNCDAAAAWVSRLGDEPAQEKACTVLIETWSVRDPAAAAAWLETLPTGKMRDAGLGTYAGRVALSDPSAAAEWAGHITDPTQRGNAAGMVYLHWALEDPVAAREWFHAFPDIDEKHRRAILREYQ